MALSSELAHYAQCDRTIIDSVRNIRLLNSLSWPSSVQNRFLSDWHRGQPQLPTIDYPRYDLSDLITTLSSVCRTLDEAHPIGRYLKTTAESYITAARLLENLGTAAVTACSVELYGRPGDSLAGGNVHNIDAAQHFIDVSHEYDQEFSLHEADYCLSAETMQRELYARIAPFFHRHKVSIIIDPNLVSKAAAGPTRIRLRGGTCFSQYDLEQLLEHEAFVHSLTALNGREQTHFKTLGLGAPRTTGTQEGLATFAELVTGAIDISRMERIALRIIAIDKALNGADFIDVFKFFLESGQTEMESFNSAMRVFRGAPLTGGAAFTKDTVYLHGLMEVHTFFRWCLQHQKLRLCRYLFAGRMTINDVIHLEPFFEQGVLSAPLYVPPWLMRTNGLAGYLAFSVFANKIRIAELHEGYTFDDISEIGI